MYRELYHANITHTRMDIHTCLLTHKPNIHTCLLHTRLQILKHRHLACREVPYHVNVAHACMNRYTYIHTHKHTYIHIYAYIHTGTMPCRSPEPINHACLLSGTGWRRLTGCLIICRPFSAKEPPTIGLFCGNDLLK